MTVSERLDMRLRGSPDPDRDDGYAMYPNWQLRMEIADAKALEAKLEAMNTTPMMLALANALSDWQDSGSMTGAIEIFVPVDIARAIRVWVAAQQ
jgi:hypothetical protein